VTTALPDCLETSFLQRGDKLPTLNYRQFGHQS
jgi:hypothetical protein